MIEPSQHMIEPQEEKTPVAQQQDTTCKCVENGLTGNGYAAEQATQANERLREAAPSGIAEQSVKPSEMLNRHAEAGRKGARRIHELIQQGRLYEREHGLKPGRQRLRQLIQEGRLYEREHGAKDGAQGRPDRHRPRISSEQLLNTLFETLLRLAKPAYRSRIVGMIQALEADGK
jgi:hypothetical protein